MSFLKKIFGAEESDPLSNKMNEKVDQLKNLKVVQKLERKQLYRELRKLGREMGEPAIPILVDALYYHSGLKEFDLNLYLDLLASFGEPAIKPLVNALSRDRGGLMAHFALIKIGKDAVDPLIDALRSDDENSLYFGARALGRIGDKRAIEPLINLYKTNSHWRIRNGVALALGWLGEPMVVPDLVYMLNQKMASQLAIDGLSIIGEPAIEPLLDYIQDEKNKGFPIDNAKKVLRRLGYDEK